MLVAKSMAPAVVIESPVVELNTPATPPPEKARIGFAPDLQYEAKL